MKNSNKNNETANARNKRAGNAPTFAHVASDAMRDVRVGTRGLFFALNTLNKACKKNDYIDNKNVAKVGKEVAAYHEAKQPFHLSACYTRKGIAYAPIRVKDERDVLVHEFCGNRHEYCEVKRCAGTERVHYVRQLVVRDARGNAYRLAPCAQSPVGLLRAFVAYVKMQQAAAKEPKKPSQKKQISELMQLRKEGLISDKIFAVRMSALFAA